MNIPIYNCIIDENTDDETGIYAISFVDAPANETDFITLGRSTVHLNKNTKKQILTGVVLKPDQLIYRNSNQLGEHYIRFSAGQIEKIAQKMMKTGIALHSTTHQHQEPLTGNYLTELWIVENPANDKSRALGFKNLPKGTLMCSYKIEDQDYWQREVMSGNVKGFSLEGLFSQEISMSRLSPNNNVNMKKREPTILKKLARFLLEIDTVERADETESGETYREFTLKDGQVVKVDKDSFATLDGEQMPAGEHILADGNLMLVDENGEFVQTKEASETTTSPDDAIAPQAFRKAIQKLEEENADAASLQVLKETIEQLEAIIAGLKEKASEAGKEAGEAKEQLQQLKKNMPSISPLIPNTRKGKAYESHTDKMAHILSLQVKNR